MDPTDERLNAYSDDNSEPIDENGNTVIFDKSSVDKKNKAHVKLAKSRKKQVMIDDIQKRWNELD